MICHRLTFTLLRTPAQGVFVSNLERPPRYRAYLLRCWQERSQQPEHLGVWRFSLQEPHSGQRRGFASLEALMAFLETQLAIDEDAVDANEE